MTQLPNFFLLGAAKSGTTALYYWLANRPEVHLSTPKEPYFFEDEFALGTDFYWRKYFATGYRGQPLVGDCRTTHLYLPYVAQRIHATAPGARLVVILRNPAERAFSHWWMQRCNGWEALDFRGALEANQRAIDEGNSFEGERAEKLWKNLIAQQPDRHGVRRAPARALLEPGHYAQQLERYLEYFPREQLLVLMHEDLRDSPIETLQRLAAFLGIDAEAVDGPPRRENVALSNFSRQLSVTATKLRLDRVLPQRVLRALRNGLSRFGRRPEMTAEDRAWLQRHFAEHNRRLESLLGVDLSRWGR